MELPHLGQHCSNSSCKQLDFLPFKCDACSKTFCKDHYNYVNHGCQLSFKKDFQVPQCPLCNQPVPYKRNELPDIVMSAHIDRDCKSDPAEERRRQIFNHKCNKKGCKQKELMPLVCKKCNKNYCLKHRHENDHNCSEQVNSQPNLDNRSKPKSVNAARLAFFDRNKNTIQSSSMSDNDALQLALKMSMNEQNGSRDANKQITDDEAFARALAQSEREEQTRQQNNSSNNRNNENDNSSCIIN